MREGILVKRAKASDRYHVVSLLREHLPATVDVEARYRWLYRENPHGTALTWLAIDRATAEPIGLTSLFPRRVSIHGVERLGSIAGDDYVRASYGDRGIAADLQRASVRQMGDAGVELVYGPFAPEMPKSLVAVGSRVVCHLRRFVRPLSLPLPPAFGCLSRVAKKALSPRRSLLRLLPTAEEDSRIRRLWEEALWDLPIAPVRDPAFYAWRFARSPANGVRQYLVVDGSRTVAACALLREGNKTVILDVLAPRERWQLALEAILHECRDSALVEVRLNERGPIASLLWRNGFVPRDRKEFRVLVDDGHPQAQVLRRAASWYYTSGDGDPGSFLSDAAAA